MYIVKPPLILPNPKLNETNYMYIYGFHGGSVVKGLIPGDRV